jgi:murein DD-endopeptidase MepM/ murein hydrolase activator NlpD
VAFVSGVGAPASRTRVVIAPPADTAAVQNDESLAPVELAPELAAPEPMSHAGSGVASAPPPRSQARALPTSLSELLLDVPINRQLRSNNVAAVQLAAAAMGVAGSDVESPVIAEYAPVAIESLPLHRPRPKADAWSSSRNLTVVTKGVIESGRSLSTSLRSQGVESSAIHLIAREMKPVFNFRRSRPGDRYRLGQDPDGRVLDFRYTTSPDKSYYLAWEGSRYVVREEATLLKAQVAKASGVVESSLYEAIKALGEQTQLANDFADIFAWNIDFSRNVRPGDDFQILYERLYRTDDDGVEVYVKPGRILAARYRGGVGDHSVVYYEDEDGQGAYYRPDGSSIERAFLVAPLKFSRITSSFSNARRHPILKVVRPHRGIDYAASPGTPLWAVVEGTVIFRGWAGASGNLVKIKHANGYVSYYAHLARFEPGIRVGQQVSQKQTIGYVGQTGLATGPHVCFRVQKNGRYVNPLNITGPAGSPITAGDWASFKARRDVLLSDLGTGALVAADEAL